MYLVKTHLTRWHTIMSDGPVTCLPNVRKVANYKGWTLVQRQALCECLKEIVKWNESFEGCLDRDCITCNARITCFISIEKWITQISKCLIS